MPRDGKMIWCDRCGIFVAPKGKKPTTRERAAEVLTDTDVICVKCAARHGITADNYPPTPEQAPAPAPQVAAPSVIAKDPAQAALDALPNWIKEDGARHGRNRLKAAVAEVERLSTPAPADRDVKEAPKPARPVRRPARPRREPSPSALATLAPAWDTNDMASVERIHDESVGAPAPRPWSKGMPDSTIPAPKPAPRPTPRPALTQAELLRRRHELAAAYAAKHGTDMAPRQRRPIVTAEEIKSGLRTVPMAEDGTPARFHPDIELGKTAARAYLQVHQRTWDRWEKQGTAPSPCGTDASGNARYRVGDLDAFRAQPLQKPAPAAPNTTAESKKAARPPRRERVERLAAALAEGLDPKEAAARAGYSYLPNARLACKEEGRHDLLEMMPDARTAPPHVVAAQKRSVERVAELEELMAAGIAPADAVTRVGYKNVASACRQLDRMRRHDLASWVRRGRRREAVAA